MADLEEKVNAAMALPDGDLGPVRRIRGPGAGQGAQDHKGLLRRASVTRLGSRCQHRSVVLLVLFIVDAARGASVHKKVMSEEPVLIGALTSHEALELNGRVLDAANPGMFSSSVDCSDACYVLLEPDAPPVRDGAGRSFDCLSMSTASCSPPTHSAAWASALSALNGPAARPMFFAART